MHLILLRALQYALVVLPLFTSAQDTTSPPASLSTTLSQSVISSNPSASPTSASIPPAPTVNSTVGTSQDLFLWPPQGGLRQCERVTFSFTKPAVPLTCGIYVTNTSTYLEQVILSPTYNTLISGTFAWTVDMPVGLSVNVQVFVTINGQISQYTLPNMVVQEGQDNSCLGRNVGQNTQSIISYASSLNGSYVYASPSSSSTSSSSGGSSGGKGGLSGGAIAGIVIGVLVGAVLIALCCFYKHRRLQRRSETENVQMQDQQFVQQVIPASQVQGPPPTYAQNYANSVMSGSTAGSPYKRSAPPGTVAEPMSTTPPPRELNPGSPLKGEMGMREGTQGLADPSSFVSRSNSHKAL